MGEFIVNSGHEQELLGLIPELKMREEGGGTEDYAGGGVSGGNALFDFENFLTLLETGDFSVDLKGEVLQKLILQLRAFVPENTIDKIHQHSGKMPIERQKAVFVEIRQLLNSYKRDIELIEQFKERIANIIGKDSEFFTFFEVEKLRLMKAEKMFVKLSKSRRDLHGQEED